MGKITVLFFLIVSGNVFAEHIKPAMTTKSCTECHQKSQNSWQQSDHAKAMAQANAANVLGDFNNKTVSHYKQKAVFFIKNNQYRVTLSDEKNTLTYPIKYTFGHFPLQQYLVEVEQGKLQVLPFAWDARKETEGGQRWYHNYSNEEISLNDRLHWRQPLQNWNGMCADCHSDGLIRHYNEQSNSFSSHFENTNVSCLSCHGKLPADHHKPKRNVVVDVLSETHPTGQWIRDINDKVAHWQGKTRNNAFMDNCFACHSLRSPITDGFTANTSFLDQFTPSLLVPPLYYADGQIKEEVYVYGSFLQSKMYAAGVNCLDCHDKHTMKVKVEGNGLCLQCHNGAIYNDKSHHQHQESSSGSKCINCHMATNRYMGVDDRRDHSFKIPRPDLSTTFSTPNACIKCHKDKSNNWAKKNVAKWHGKPQPLLASKRLLMTLHSGQTLSLDQHLSIIDDHKLDSISRATAIQLLAKSTASLDANVLIPYLNHSEPLLRLSAASASALLTDEDKVKYLAPLLTDQYKAIRLAAARQLVTVNLYQGDVLAFESAFQELVNSYQINSWRGEGRLNQGILAFEMDDLANAKTAFTQAIAIEPYYVEGYLNLAELYRLQQDENQVASTLLNGIDKLPKASALHYSYGLHLFRVKQINKAIVTFKKAVELSPDNEQFAYTYILALDSGQQTSAALLQLKTLILQYQNNGNLVQLGLYLSEKQGSTEDYQFFMNF